MLVNLEHQQLTFVRCITLLAVFVILITYDLVRRRISYRTLLHLDLKDRVGIATLSLIESLILSLAL